MQAAAVRWDLGLTTHAALVVDFKCEAAEPAWVRAVPKALDLPPAVGWATARAAVTAAACERCCGPVWAALAAGDTAEAWRALEFAMREWLSSRAGLADVPARPHAHARWRLAHPRASGSGRDASSHAADAALLRWRRQAAAKKGVEVDEMSLAGQKMMIEAMMDQQSDPYFATARMWDDGIIDPRDTRSVLGICLSTCYNAPVKGTNAWGVFRH